MPVKQFAISVAQTPEEVLADLVPIVVEYLKVDPDKVRRETSAVRDLRADSLSLVEIMMEIERVFSVAIPDEQAAPLKNIGELVDLIVFKRAEKD